MPLDPTVACDEFDPESVLAEMVGSETTSAENGVPGLFRSIKQSQAGFVERHELERTAKIRMAALKRFSPLVLASIHRPGPDADGAELSVAIRSMMDESYRLAKEVTERVYPNGANNEFILEQSVSAVSEFVGTEWAFWGKLDVRDRVMTVIDHLSEMGDVVEVIGQSHWTPDGNFEEATLRAGLTMSMIKDTEPILSLLADYQLNDIKLFEALSDTLLEASLDYLGRVSQELPTATRLHMIQNHLGVSGRIMKASLAAALREQQPRTASELNIKPVIRSWKTGIQILNASVEAKVKVAMDRNDLLKPAAKSMEVSP